MDDGTVLGNPTRRRCLRPVLAGPVRAGRWVADQALADRGRWILWTPVAIGVGVGWYLDLAVEPPASAGIIATAIAAAVAVAVRRRPRAFIAAVAVLLVAAGFAAAQIRTDLVAAPVLHGLLTDADVRGRVLTAESLAYGSRIILDQPIITGLAAADTPARLNIRLRAGLPPPPPGAVIALTADLRPPPPPAMPGAPDPRRQAWFARIGANGFASRLPVMLKPPPADGLTGIATALETDRVAIIAKIDAAVPDRATAGVIVALMTGRKTAIPDTVLADLRGAGLAHIIVIAGLHIGLVAGLVFVACRSLLALLPSVALRFPIKKWAAIVSFGAAAGYTLLVGAPVPTLRAVAMTTLALLGIVIDRTPVGMRLIASAAVIVLLVDPDALTGASFQLSFAAVLALIAAYEAVRGRLVRWHSDAGAGARLLLYFFGLAFSSATATVATAPFALFHFQQIAWYGVLANMIAIPITGFWVMPWAIVALAAMTVGLESGPLAAMAWGVRGIIAVAHGVSHLPGATAPVPSMPLWTLLCITFGGLWLTLWTQPWRLAGLAPIVIGIAAMGLTPRPDVLISADGRLMAVRGADGDLLLSTRAVDRVVAQIWRQRDGIGENDKGRIWGRIWPKHGATAAGRLRCDDAGCVYRRDGLSVALIRHPRALAEDCHQADIVITGLDVAACPAPVVFDRTAAARARGIALFLRGGRLRVETVEGLSRDRPWAPAEGAPAEGAPTEGAPVQ